MTTGPQCIYHLNITFTDSRIGSYEMIKKKKQQQTNKTKLNTRGPQWRTHNIYYNTMCIWNEWQFLYRVPVRVCGNV